jgi:hypothetical protein
LARQREREAAAARGEPIPENEQCHPFIPIYNSLYILDSEQALNFRMAVPSIASAAANFLMSLNIFYNHTILLPKHTKI